MKKSPIEILEQLEESVIEEIEDLSYEQLAELTRESGEDPEEIIARMHTSVEKAIAAFVPTHLQNTVRDQVKYNESYRLASKTNNGNNANRNKVNNYLSLINTIGISPTNNKSSLRTTDQATQNEVLATNNQKNKSGVDNLNTRTVSENRLKFLWTFTWINKLRSKEWLPTAFAVASVIIVIQSTVLINDRLFTAKVSTPNNIDYEQTRGEINAVGFTSLKPNEAALKIYFKSNVTQYDVNRILQSVHARVIDGPIDATGGYLIAVPKNEMEEAITLLNKSGLTTIDAEVKM